MKRRYRFWDDYFYPGTVTLRNKLGERDAEILAELEQARVQIRAGELAMNPLRGEFDYEHFRAIHRYLFQDVYDWAGEERTAPSNWLTKWGPDVINYAVGDPTAPQIPYSYFPAGSELGKHAEAQFARLAEMDYLRGLTTEEFARELAEVWGELNVAHSFREGNTRTQAVFFAQLAEQAGHPLRVEELAKGGALRESFVAARFYSQATGRNDRLAGTIVELTAPPPATGDLTRPGSPVDRDRAQMDEFAQIMQTHSSGRRSTIGLHDDGDGPDSLTNSQSLTL